MTLAEQFENFLAIPSYHYHPLFAQEVQKAIIAFRPSAIAIEVSELWAEEFKWGVSCWPCPMVSFADRTLLPVVPGDSMVEAFRLGQQSQLPLFFIDLALNEPAQRKLGPVLPDPAFAPRVGKLFLETVDALNAAASSPAEVDVAREAYMAQRLCDLAANFERILWVGGMAHWSRMRDRLQRRCFDGPNFAPRAPPTFYLRMRLGWSALHRITQRLPFQVAQYARRPQRYSESACLNRLALAAVKPEKFQAVEVAAMLVYARNLAAMNGLAETPDLWDLLTSSSSVFGNEYASRLASLALREHLREPSQKYPLLTYSVEQDPNGRSIGVYRCGRKIIDGEPLWQGSHAGYRYRLLPSLIEIKKRGDNDPAKTVSNARKGEKTGWAVHPDDEKSYEWFVRYLLEHASGRDLDETDAVPLTSGMAEGLDIRATIRHWQSGDIYVRESARSPVKVTNGLIDWTSSSEKSWILQNSALPTSRDKRYPDVNSRGGWIDPSLSGVGSASWEVRKLVEVQSKPFWIQLDHRELSLITLDTPTWIKKKSD